MKMKANKHVIGFLCVVMLIGCAPPKIIMNQNYKKGNYSSPSLSIVIKTSGMINYSGNVEPEFGPGRQDSLIWEFFKRQFIADVKAKTAFKNVGYDTCSTLDYFTRKQVDARDHYDEFYLLNDGGTYKCASTDPTFVLVLNDIGIGTELQSHYSAPMVMPGPYGTMTMVGGGGGTSKSLMYHANMVLYDNVAKTVVEYGIVDAAASSSFIPIITMNNWLDVSSSFTEKIFGGSMFAKSD